MSRYPLIESAIDETLELLFSRECGVCEAGVRGASYCESCVDLRSIEPPLCQRCGQNLPVEMTLCGRCEKRDESMMALDRLRSAYWYEEKSRKLWIAIKFRHRFFLLPVLKKRIEELNLDLAGSESVIVPIPMTFARYRRRKINLSEWLSLLIARKTKRPIHARLLKRVGSGARLPQSLSSRRARLKNIRGTFAIAKTENLPRRVLLVDDVLTTGATLAECAKVLKKAGVEEVSAWTLFRTPDPTSFRNALERIQPPREHRRDQHHTDY